MDVLKLPKKIDAEYLSEAMSRERGSEALQELPPNFYDKGLEELRMLKSEIEKTTNYREISMLDDQIKGIKMLMIGILERRIAKIVFYAAIETSGTDVKPSLLPMEKEFYKNIMKDYGDYYGKILKELKEF
jgi:DNA replication initiation complex subunit (GINS family)